MRRGVRVSLVACLACLIVLPATARVSASPPPGVKRTGSVEREPADVAKALGLSVAGLREAASGRKTNGTGILFPSESAIFQIYRIVRTGFVETVVAKRDLASMQLRGVTVFERIEPTRVNGQNGGDWSHAVDEAHGRLFLAFGGSTPDGFLAIDVKTLRAVKLTLPTTGSYQPIRLWGFEYDTVADRIWGYANLANLTDPSGSFSTNGLVAWPATFETDTTLPPAQIRPIRACRGLALTFSAFAVPLLQIKTPDLDAGGAMKDYFIFPCGSGSTGIAIVRIQASAAFDPSTSEKIVVGPSGVVSALVDKGSGRFFFMNASAGANVSAWVYEAASNAIIGVIAVSRVGNYSSQVIGFGVDQETGRLYGLGPDLGIFFADARFDPVPQAQTFPTLAGNGRQRILADAARSRIFVLRGELEPGARYEIYSVPPPLEAPKPEDPDRNTVQVPEREGVTRRNFGGGASGYGVRVLLGGGVRGMMPVGPESVSLGYVYELGGPKCGPPNRELVLASVRDTALSASSQAASALAVHLDPTTVADLKNPSRCDVTYKGGALNTPPFQGLFAQLGAEYADEFDSQTGVEWRYGEANCQRERGEDVEDGMVSNVGDASVDCREGTISADSETEMSRPISQAVRVAHAETHTEVFLDANRGIVSRAEAIVSGIAIGDVSITEIRSVAESWAKGLRKTAGSSREVTVSGIRAPGFTCDECPGLETIRSRLNDALSGRVEIRIGVPDQGLQAGTPGGYQAAVIKSDKQVSSDNALTGDSSREVPALEVLVYNDSPQLGRSRQLYQFAGVAVDSRYGIELIPRGIGLPLDPAGFVPAPPGSVTVEPEAPSKPGDTGSTDTGLLPSPRQVVEEAAKGIAFLIASPSQGIAIAAVWLLLLAPFIAAQRRRVLKAGSS